MKITTKERKKYKIRNKLKKVSSLDRFRLSIFRSTKNISAQIIDDRRNITLLSVSSIEKYTPHNSTWVSKTSISLVDCNPQTSSLVIW